MNSAIRQFEQTHLKSEEFQVNSGDTVRVHQRVVEGSKERTQVFEGVVLRTRQMNSLLATVTVRRLSGGIGVEKNFKLHAPNIEKVEVMRHGKTRRNYLTFLRKRQGKSARLREVSADKPAAKTSAPKKPAKTTKPQSKTKQAATKTKK